jgi:4-amino-4-deoxy-L-arabinose transferase-like glycosyltransferase
MTRNPKRIFLLLALLSSAINLGALFALHPTMDPTKLDGDALEYFNLAGRIVDGTYQFDSRRVLGHVFILAAFRTITGANLVALQALVTFVFSMSAPLAYCLARRFTKNELVAATVGIVTAFWPLFLIYGKTLYSETTALPFFLLFLALLPRGSAALVPGAVPTWRWILSGAILAVAMLIRPMYLLFLPFVPLILSFEARHSPQVVRAIGWVALGWAVALAPWSIYASVHAGRALLLSANGGETLAGGLNPNLLKHGYGVYVAPDGRRTWTGPGKWVGESETGYLSPEDLALPRMERDKLLKQRTTDWILSNPGSAARLEAAKLTYMWGIYPFWNGLAQTLFGNVPTLLLIVGGVEALRRLRPSWQSLAMLWLLPLFTSGVALASWGSWRFRQPADVGLITLTVFFVWLLVSPSSLELRDDTPRPA